MVVAPEPAFPERVETARLVLRRPMQSDADAGADAIYAAYGTRETPITREAAASYGRYFIAHWQRFACGQYLIEADGRLAGVCGTKWTGRDGRSAFDLDFDVHDPAAELDLGYFIVPGARGRGYALESSRAAIGVAFGHLPVDHVGARCSPENAASVTIIERLGMIEGAPAGRMRAFRITRDHWRGLDILASQ